jgi:hypothetical protein
VTDWLDELNELREADKARREAETKAQPQDPAVLRREQAALTLRKCEAHKLLRRVQGVLLAGKGLIDIEHTGDYDRAIALLWQGPISDARLPRPDDPDEVYGIVIGAKGDKLYVNGRQVSPVTPEGLKPALVWAAKTPIHQADKGKK